DLAQKSRAANDQEPPPCQRCGQGQRLLGVEPRFSVVGNHGAANCTRARKEDEPADPDSPSCSIRSTRQPSENWAAVREILARLGGSRGAVFDQISQLLKIVLAELGASRNRLLQVLHLCDAIFDARLVFGDGGFAVRDALRRVL